ERTNNLIDDLEKNGNPISNPDDRKAVVEVIYDNDSDDYGAMIHQLSEAGVRMRAGDRADAAMGVRLEPQPVNQQWVRRMSDTLTSLDDGDKINRLINQQAGPYEEVFAQSPNPRQLLEAANEEMDRRILAANGFDNDVENRQFANRAPPIEARQPAPFEPQPERASIDIQFEKLALLDAKVEFDEEDAPDFSQEQHQHRSERQEQLDNVSELLIKSASDPNAVPPHGSQSEVYETFEQDFQDINEMLDKFVQNEERFTDVEERARLLEDINMKAADEVVDIMQQRGIRMLDDDGEGAEPAAITEDDAEDLIEKVEALTDDGRFDELRQGHAERYYEAIANAEDPAAYVDQETDRLNREIRHASTNELVRNNPERESFDLQYDRNNNALMRHLL
ncbi:MAG: hypothetical protein AAFR27_12885, partial [Pseudomonadota bacterium]